VPLLCQLVLKKAPKVLTLLYFIFHKILDLYCINTGFLFFSGTK